MDFENLQRELFERKLKIGEYFKRAFESLKVFIEKNKKVVSLLVVANICTFFFSVLQQIIKAEIKVASQVGDTDAILRGSMLSFLLLVGVLMISAGTGLIRAVVYSKIACEIEGRENEYRFKNVALKYLKFIGIYLLSVLIIGIVVSLLATITTIIFLVLTKNTEVGFFKYLPLIISMTMYLIIFLIVLNILYFIQTFYARDMKVIDTFKYNLSLSKKNRLRILVPQLILGLINCIFIIPLFIQSFIYIPSYIVFPVSIICGIISSVLGLVSIIMNMIIFLNVEYDYLKKQDEEMRKIEKNI
ncbi:hypothetical protein [Leptotrichia trevisanii]